MMSLSIAVFSDGSISVKDERSDTYIHTTKASSRELGDPNARIAASYLAANAVAEALVTHAKEEL
jgi:hypothetical protein